MRRLLTSPVLLTRGETHVELLPWSWQPLNGTRARLSRSITESHVVCGF